MNVCVLQIFNKTNVIDLEFSYFLMAKGFQQRWVCSKTLHMCVCVWLLFFVFPSLADMEHLGWIIFSLLISIPVGLLLLATTTYTLQNKPMKQHQIITKHAITNTHTRTSTHTTRLSWTSCFVFNKAVIKLWSCAVFHTLHCQQTERIKQIRDPGTPRGPWGAPQGVHFKMRNNIGRESLRFMN